MDVAKFDQQLKSNLLCWVNMCRDGRSIKQSLEGFVREAPEPTAGFMGETLEDIETTDDYADSIKRIAERANSPYFEKVVQAILEHYENGGSLCEELWSVRQELGDTIGGDDWYNTELR